MNTQQTQTYPGASSLSGGQSPGKKGARTGLSWAERYAGLPAASRHLNYLGHEIRAFIDADGAAWLVLMDIFRALEKRSSKSWRQRIKNPSDVMEVVAWVPNTVNPGDSGYRMLKATNPQGINDFLGVSRQQRCVDLLGWLQCQNWSESGGRS